MLELETTWYCGYCGEENLANLDPSAGENQLLIEDCAVCCHPNTLHVSIDLDNMEADIEVECDE